MLFVRRLLIGLARCAVRYRPIIKPVTNSDLEVINMADQVLQELTSSAKIERDRGVLDLQRYLNTAQNSDIKQIEAQLICWMRDGEVPWETVHGALMGSAALITHQTAVHAEDFARDVQEQAIKLLEHKESRIRLATGELMGELSAKHGPSVYASCREKVLQGVRSNLDRQPLDEAGQAEKEQADKLREKLLSDGERRNSNAEDIFHDTAGWKSLETWMKCLQSMIEGCGPGFNQYIDQELLDLIFTSLSHTNRFVRETGYFVCAALVSCNTKDGEVVTDLGDDNAIFRHGEAFAEHVARGMADNWSQVRLAASAAGRKFILGLPEPARHKYFPQVLPPLCLNRYYVAEGVRIYNQDTWRMVTGGDGRHAVETYINDVVRFYISQTEADNHAVREAACACIAELGSKIDRDVVRPHVTLLLDALLVCFKDESWPVRDASCVACGNFVLCFPEESKPALEELYPLFFENLQDNIPSVRQGAAIALANVVRAYGQEAATFVMGKMEEGLAGVEKQPENTEKYSSMEKGPATYGVVKQLRDNDMELHSNQQMYSCGSLAPKMHRGKRGGGCMDHQFKRQPEPWEMTDGCCHLVAELSQIQEIGQQVAKQLPLVAKAASFKQYTQHVHFLETLCKELPIMAKGLGKRNFKMHLELFFDAIFYALACDNALTSTAASQCLNQLATFIGPNILRGRVEQYNPRYLDAFGANQFTAPL